MSDQRNRFLFVYGTLMARASGTMGERERAHLARQSEAQGAASVVGQLFDLGAYPGLILDPCGRTRVSGEVVRLFRPQHTFACLDQYEDVEPVGATTCDFTRVETAVRLTTGKALMAWVYVYRGSLARARLIVDGRWQKEPHSAHLR